RDHGIRIWAQHFLRARGIHQDGEWRELEAVAIVALDWLQDGGRKVSTAPHWFRQNELRRTLVRKQLRCGDELRKAAAETAALDFLGVETRGLRQPRVHQLSTLVVQDDAGASSHGSQPRTRRQQQRRFSRAQKSANQNQMRGQDVKRILEGAAAGKRASQRCDAANSQWSAVASRLSWRQTQMCCNLRFRPYGIGPAPRSSQTVDGGS